MSNAHMEGLVKSRKPWRRYSRANGAQTVNTDFYNYQFTGFPEDWPVQQDETVQWLDRTTGEICEGTVKSARTVNGVQSVSVRMDGGKVKVVAVDNLLVNRYQGGMAYCKYCYETHDRWELGGDYSETVWVCGLCDHATADHSMEIEDTEPSREQKRFYIDANTLSADEQTALEQHEQIIERGIKVFFEVGEALLAIRDQLLYRADFRTFEDYCQERWGLKQSHAYRFIAAAQTIGNLKSSPMGELPQNERQTRPLTSLPAEIQSVAWEVANKTAKGNVTGVHVQSVANVVKGILATGAIDDGTGHDIPIETATVDHLKAAITEETYERLKRQEEYIREKQAEKDRRRAAKAEAKATVPENLPVITERYQLIEGDFRTHLQDMAADSIDAIITDPPYPKEYLPLYGELARLSAHVLKPGGSLLVMIGQSYLPDILQLMCEHMTYHWALSYLTPGGQATQLWQRNVNTFWKPVLWFVKGDYEGDWQGDVLKSSVNDNDKRFHHWGQSESGMADIVERFTYPGQTILDPFVGGGTTGVVAIKMNRLFIGVDCDPNAISTSKERLSQCR